MDKKILKVTAEVDLVYEVDEIDEDVAKELAKAWLARALEGREFHQDIAPGDPRIQLSGVVFGTKAEIVDRPALKRYKVELAIEQRSTMDVFIRAEDEHAAGLKAAAMLDDPNHDRSEYVMDWDYCEDSVPYVVGEVDEEGNLI